jgi:hypothetical protein
MKLKRRNVEARYGQLIEALYQEPQMETARSAR